ncbi:hypothetical protein [Desulfolutivibrio sulfoxidireducens]|nr:hypothetical protein [Desulfolutivibrio sulfoxidireducens]QLA16309.1 hypothetical protein GD605_09345 [Desulfolutivibrio sulfoxidireducens]QLA19800.1 hypothetical protein GD604_08655 [Desulfolutivibrio sulfoxidireducens]
MQCRKWMRAAVMTCAVAATGCLAGCAEKAPPPPFSPTPLPVATSEETPPKAEDPRYVDAVTALLGGDAELAATLFEQVRQSAGDEPSRRRALYGLACARLLLAQDEKELAKAKALWETWRAGSPPGGDGEDPRLMAGMLPHFRPVFLLKDLKAACEKECDKRLLEKEEEVRRIIQRQVQALEEIHREIQEKKKGLSTY